VSRLVISTPISISISEAITEATWKDVLVVTGFSIAIPNPARTIIIVGTIAYTKINFVLKDNFIL